VSRLRRLIENAAGVFRGLPARRHRELFDWVKTTLPAKAVIAKDSRILLPDPENPHDSARFEPLPQTILAGKYAADLGTIDELRKRE